MSRGENYFDIFRGGVPPVETVLGESYGLGRRTASSTVFARAGYRLDSARGSYGLESPAQIPDQGLFWAFSRLTENPLGPCRRKLVSLPVSDFKSLFFECYSRYWLNRISVTAQHPFLFGNADPTREPDG